MAAQKRPLSAISIEDATAPKIAKTSTNNDWRDLFEIKIKIPSSIDWDSMVPTHIKMHALSHGDIKSWLADKVHKDIIEPANSLLDSTGAAVPEQITSPKKNEMSEDRVEKVDQDSDNDMDADEDTDEDTDDDEDEDDDSGFGEYEGYEWLEPINASVLSKKTNANGKPDCIGSCSSVLIDRDRIRPVFYNAIHQPSEETSSMGFGLFDRYGRLKLAFKKDSVRSGSGIWGDELNCGDILLIDQVRIDKRYRRQGIGQEMVRVILQKALARCDPETFVAIARSAAITSEVRDECEDKSYEEEDAIYDRERRTVECFLRSLGFRRIGYTEWFAFAAGDAQHACHSLPADQDFDPPEPTPGQTTNAVLETLLCAFDKTKEDAVRLGLAQKAFESYGPEDDTWVSTDRNGNTLLHHVAISENPACIKWIVEKCPHLITIRNLSGDTPFDSCQEHLENIHNEEGLDKFNGHSQLFVEILSNLKGLSNPSQEELQRLKYGCTCGQCQGGFLSPRMHSALLSNAEITSDLLFDGIARSDGDSFVEVNGHNLKYLQPGVRDNMRTNKSIRQGFASIFGRFAEFLQDSTEPPRANKIFEMILFENEWPPVTKNYLKRGGTVEAVGSTLFMKAMNESRWAGGGIHWEAFEDNIEALPACRNDDEFGFVSGLCGYERVSQIEHSVD
ncbi:hypothetical protein GGI43DRAFT_410944 [Trichoderma evansii]